MVTVPWGALKAGSGVIGRIPSESIMNTSDVIWLWDNPHSCGSPLKEDSTRGVLALLPPDSYPVAGDELAIEGPESAFGVVPPVRGGGAHGWRPG